MKKRIYWVIPSGSAGSQSITPPNEYFILGAIDDANNTYQMANSVVATLTGLCLDEFYAASDSALAAQLITSCDYDKNMARSGTTQLETTTTWSRILVMQLINE